MEILDCRNAFVPAGIIYHILVDDSAENERIDKSAVIRRLYLDIRSDAAAVTHYPAGNGPEFLCKRIRNVSDASVLVTVRIVDGLYTSSARSIILGGSDFHLTVVRKRKDRLDQALSVTSLALDHSPVQILEGTGNDF